jgi:hypothetical protein
MKPSLDTIFLARNVISVFLGFIPLLLPAIDNHKAGARSLALSHATVSFSDNWASFHNQAGLSGHNNVSAGFFFESKFGIDVLSFAAGSLIFPAVNGVFAFSVSRLGNVLYHEDKFGLAYARQLFKSIKAGLQFDYFGVFYPENSHAKGFATFEGGLIFQPDDKIHLGIHIFNPVSAGIEWADGLQKMPVVLRLGGHYNFDKYLLLALEAEKNNHNPVLFKSGIEFIPAPKFALRVGFSGKPINYSMGIGYITELFSSDIGFSYHGNLGISPSISVQIKL